MKLHYNSEKANHIEIKERMDSLTLAYEVLDSKNEQAVLEDGKLSYKGDLEITKHLDDVAGELHSWYYCNC